MMQVFTNVTFVVGDFKQSSSTGTRGASPGSEQLRHRASQRVVVTGARPRPVVPSHQFTRRLGLLRERHSARPGSVERTGWLAGYIAWRPFCPPLELAPPRAPRRQERQGVAGQHVPFCENQRVGGSGAGGRRRRWGPGLGVCGKHPQDSSPLARRPLPPPNFPP